jgi:hypothetical protein
VVTPQPTTQYRWQSWAAELSVASDLEPLIQRLEQLPANTVLDLALSGQIDLAGEQRLQQALSVMQGRCRSLQCDQAGLRLAPTAEDIAALHADGYLGEVITELQQRQEQPQADGGTAARDALAILAGLLRDRQAAEQQA